MIVATLLVVAISSSPQEISQADLAVRVLDTCDRNPTALNTIRAINQIVALGPEQGKKTLDKYFEDTELNNKGGLYLFVRCMFDVPRKPGFLSMPKLGHFNPMPPSDLRQSPRFPCALAGDIPLWVGIGNGAFAGFPEPISRHYQRLSFDAHLRTKPLTPVDNPWRIVGGTSLPDNVDFGAVRSNMNVDVLALVSTAYRPKGYVFGKHSVYTDTPGGWRLVVSELEKSGIRWDRNRQLYVRADGSVLPSK